MVHIIEICTMASTLMLKSNNNVNIIRLKVPTCTNVNSVAPLMLSYCLISILAPIILLIG